jgi:hypothetical protein
MRSSIRTLLNSDHVSQRECSAHFGNYYVSILCCFIANVLTSRKHKHKRVSELFDLII